MKLAKYLAIYIKPECDKPEMEKLIQAGIEAFASTENVSIYTVTPFLKIKLEQIA